MHYAGGQRLRTQMADHGELALTRQRSGQSGRELRQREAMHAQQPAAGLLPNKLVRRGPRGGQYYNFTLAAYSRTSRPASAA